MRGGEGRANERARIWPMRGQKTAIQRQPIILPRRQFKIFGHRIKYVAPRQLYTSGNANRLRGWLLRSLEDLWTQEGSLR